MLKTSALSRGARVPFPSFTGERIYMRKFNQDSGLPQDLRRWQDTVDAMLQGVHAPGPIYLMVDQAAVKAGQLHRRGGLHVDGHWKAESGRHHHVHLPRPRGPAMQTFEGLILASDILGCAAYVGPYFGDPAEDGDCSHIDTSMLHRVDLDPGYTWRGHASQMLHEAIPQRREGLRTLVRLNVPGWVPN